jgi:hypothetical protein
VRCVERLRQVPFDPTWEKSVERDPVSVDGGRVERAELSMWLWLLGAYEAVRTMHPLPAAAIATVST